MGKDHTIEIKERWFDISEWRFPGKITAGEVSSIVVARPVRINFTVIVPGELIEGKPPKFDLDKCVPVERLWQNMARQFDDTMVAIAEARRSDTAGDADAYAEADKLLKALNAFMKRSFQQLRPMIREAVAKSVGGKAKAEDLQTVGSIDFKEYDIKAGAFANEIEVEPPLLDLEKAFKSRKWQECGMAWNGRDGVISVKRKKEFKASELKELRELLPKNKSVGASMLACKFMAESNSSIVFEITGKDSPPGERVIIRAIRKQSKRVVRIRFVVGQDDLEDEDETEEGSQKNKGKAKSKGKKAETKKDAKNSK